MDEEIKEQQKGAETLEIAKTVFNPQVAQFVPSADTCYEFSVHPDLMSHIIGINGNNLSRLSSSFAVRFVFPTSDIKLRCFTLGPSIHLIILNVI